MELPFDERCPIWHSAQLFGDATTLMILRDLFRKKACRFDDFDFQGRGISPNTLSRRLKALEEKGFIERQRYCEHPPRYKYILTREGKKLGPVLKAMSDWGKSQMSPEALKQLQA